VKRRGARASPISLFAFQDIMASVIGMVFLVVLILALSIVHDKAGGAGLVNWQTVSDADLAMAQAQVNELKRRVHAAEEDLRHLSARLEFASSGEKEALEKVKRMERTLKALYETIQETEKAAAEKDADSEALQKRLALMQQELRRLEAQRDALRLRLASRPHLAFIIDPHPDRLEPWLLEVTENSLRLAAKDGTSAVLEFRAPSAEQRKEGFLAWIETQDPQTHYFVLLVKPSGVRFAEELERILTERGFEIGKDLLPESWEPFLR